MYVVATDLILVERFRFGDHELSEQNKNVSLCHFFDSRKNINRKPSAVEYKNSEPNINKSTFCLSFLISVVILNEI